jgi:hypothetical protein
LICSKRGQSPHHTKTSIPFQICFQQKNELYDKIPISFRINRLVNHGTEMLLPVGVLLSYLARYMLQEEQQTISMRSNVGE